MQREAYELVDLLLETEYPLLIGFGPVFPGGHAVTGDNLDHTLFNKFIRALGTQSPVPQIKPDEDATAAMNQLIRNGYSFVLRDTQEGVGLYGNADRVDLSELADYGIEPSTEVYRDKSFGTRTGARVKIRDLGKAERADKDNGKTELLAFGGIENPPNGSYVRTDSIRPGTLQTGVQNGIRYVLRHPGGRVTLVLPERTKGADSKLDPAELQVIARKFNLNPQDEVDVYISDPVRKLRDKHTMSFGELQRDL